MSSVSLSPRPSNCNALLAIARRFKSLEARHPSVAKPLLSILDQAIVSGTSFVSAAIIGRLTTPDELGLYYLVLSIMIIGVALQDNVVMAPYLVYCKRKQGRDLAEYSGSTWMHLLIFGAISALVLSFVIAVFTTTGLARNGSGLFVLSAAAPLILLRGGARRFAFANLHVRTAIALDAFVAAVQLGGLALLGYFGWLSLASIFAVMGVACGVACIGLYLLAPPNVRFVRERFFSDWQGNWPFAKWTLRSYLVGSTTIHIVLWFLGTGVGTAAAGVFGACDTLVGMTNVIGFGVSNVLAPLAAQAYVNGGASDLRRTLGYAGAFLLLTLGGFCVLLISTGDWLAVLVFGSEFHGSGRILVLMAFSALLTNIGMVAGSGLWAIDRPQSNFLADVVAMTVTLVSAALLIVPFGAAGAAFTILAGALAGCLVRTITLVRYLVPSSAASNIAVTR